MEAEQQDHNCLLMRHKDRILLYHDGVEHPLSALYGATVKVVAHPDPQNDRIRLLVDEAVFKR